MVRLSFLLSRAKIASLCKNSTVNYELDSLRHSALAELEYRRRKRKNRFLFLMTLYFRLSKMVKLIFSFHYIH